MQQPRRALSFVAVVAAALLVVAIPAGAIPAQQWRKQADKICAAGDQQASAAVGRLVGNVSNPAALTQAQLDAIGAALAPILGQERDAIATLKPPPSIKKQVKQLLATLQKGVDEINAGGFGTYAALSRVLRPAARQAKALGLKVCGGR